MKKYRWPILDVYDVPDSEALISKCLDTLRGLTLVEQFGARNVSVLHTRPLLVEGFLGRLEESFVICFDCEMNEPENRCITIAHELGHTFEFKPGTLELFIQKRDHSYIDASEDFAEAFAHRWLTDESRYTEMRLLLDRHFKPGLQNIRAVILCD